MSGAGTDWTGRVLRLRVDGPAQGGEFVARHEGRVVFVRGGLTGETVEAVVTDDPGKAWCRAGTTSVLEASPDRVEPACPAAAAGAGCCDWSHVEPAAARALQGRVLAEQLRRIGGVTDAVLAAAGLAGESVPVVPPAGDDAATGWRTAVRWVTDGSGRPGTRRARSHEVVTEPCAQADPRLRPAVLAAGVPAGREVLAVVDDEGAVHVASRPVPPSAAGTGRGPRGGGRDARRRGAARSRARHSRAADWTLHTGGGPVVRVVAGTRWELPVDAFWQGHRSAARHYHGLVRTRAAELGPTTVWDLYGGAGLFASAVLDACPDARVTVVEAAGPALDAAGPALGAGRVRRVHSPVEGFLGVGVRRTGDRDTSVAHADGADGAGGTEGAELVVLDPPRTGAGLPVMRALAASPARGIVHLGCDPAAMARDVGALVTAGWRVRSLGGVAAFPGTHHVEGVAVLDAPDRPGA